MSSPIKTTRYEGASGERYTQEDSGSNRRIVRESSDSSVLPAVAVGVAVGAAALLLGGLPALAAGAAALWKKRS